MSTARKAAAAVGATDNRATHLVARSRLTRFRRAGMAFTEAWQAFELAELGAERVAVLEAEPALQTARVDAAEAARLVAEAPKPTRSAMEELTARVARLEQENQKLRADLVAAIDAAKAAPPR